MEQSSMIKESKLQPTLDSRQKTFTCTEKELTVWRNSLFYRYSAIVESEVRIERIDFDNEDKILSLPTWICYPIPTCLSKSVVRLFVHDSKRITLTLYFTRNGSGTFLCQGTDCWQWSQEECEVLKDLVSDYCQSEDLASLQCGLIRHPVSFLQEVFDIIHLSSPVSAPADILIQLTPGSCPEIESRNETKTDLNSTDVYIKGSENSETEQTEVKTSSPLDHSETEQSTPTIPHSDFFHKGSESSTQHVTSSSKKSARRWKSSKYDRRRALFPKRLYDKTTHQKLQRLEDNQDLMAAELSHFQNTLISHLEDVKASIKNEIKHHITQKTENLHQTIEVVKEHISKLENQIITLGKENHSLKTQIGTLQSKLKLMMDKGPTSTTSTQYEVQHPHPAETREFTPVIEDSPNQTGDKNTLESETPGNAVIYSKKIAEDNVSLKQNSLETHISLTTPVSTQNRFEILEEENCNTEKQESVECSESSADPGDNNTSQHSLRNQTPTRQRSPLQVFNEIKIPDNISSVLIGDSVLRFIDPRRLGTEEDRVFKLCIPGMTVQNMIQWLHSLPDKLTHIQHMIVHVGVNDCPAGPVSAKQWTELITLCKKSFPSACITFSSIIPARGRHVLNNAISPSNRTLHSACNTSKINLIDNHDTFITKNGAPRLALYKDPVHLSLKGTAKLAVNFMKYLPRFFRYNSGQHSEGDFPPRRQPRSNQQVEELSDAFHNRLHSGRTDSRAEPSRPSGHSSNVPGVPSITSMAHYPPLPSRRGGGPFNDRLYPVHPEGPVPVRSAPALQQLDAMDQTVQPSFHRLPQDRGNLSVQETHGVPFPLCSNPPHYPFQGPWYPSTLHPYPSSLYPPSVMGDQTHTAIPNHQQLLHDPRVVVPLPNTRYPEGLPTQPGQYALQLMNMASQLFHQQRPQ